MLRRPSALTGFWIVTSAIWIRPPGVSTRKISANTASLSGIRSITPFEITTSKLAPRERQPFRLALDAFHVRRAHFGDGRARFRQHLLRHVDAGDVPALANHLRRDERVGASPGTEIEHPLTRSEPAQLPRVCDPGERANGGLGHACELGRIAEVLGPEPTGREDEVLLRLLRDGCVRLLDLALQNFNVDLDLKSHHASYDRGVSSQRNSYLKGMEAGRRAVRGCHEVAATSRPLAPVSAATIRIAIRNEVTSAPTPAISAPSTKPKSRQKR